MADKRYRSGVCGSSKPEQYRSDTSRGSSASDFNLTDPSTFARQPSPIDFTNLSCQMELNDSDHSSHYLEQGWCYTTESPEPMDHGDPGDGNDLAASTYVFPSQSNRPTLDEEKHSEKETTTEKRNKKRHTWEADSKGYLMSQGAMDSEAHTLYDTFFDIPVSQGPGPSYSYPKTINIEDPYSPEPNDRLEDIDAAADRPVGGTDQAQGAYQTAEEEEWAYIEKPYPELDDENGQGRFTAQRYYQAAAASWFPSLSRH